MTIGILFYGRYQALAVIYVSKNVCLYAFIWSIHTYIDGTYSLFLMNSKEILMNIPTLRCILFSVVSTVMLGACHATSIDVTRAKFGILKSEVDIQASLRLVGPITMTKHLAAHWEVDRAGLINLDSPKAIAAGLEAGPESIEIYTYSITHPQFGTYLIDSGVSKNFLDAKNNTDLTFIVRAAMNTDSLKVVKTTSAIADSFSEPIKGVLLSHIHLDHIMGLSDLPFGTPVYIGPGDSKLTRAENLFTQGTTDRLLVNVDSLREWPFNPEAPSSSAIDLFGDGSVWAIHSPGHTPGSTAYLVQSTNGLQLITGDASHTRWGWINGVEPGTFSTDQPASLKSLTKLKKFVTLNPGTEVHPGHQSL
ncbi:MAG: N-acyl homoserine lactone hydrolase [Candidatus Azotimanducaceae bacterium]|jgi:N-acyl homoserine lactone hydrolase